MSHQTTIFDAIAAREHAETGIAAAAENNAAVLVRVKAIAREIGRRQRFVTSDDVARQMQRQGIRSEHLGNAAGSVFRGREWRYTGRTVASERISAHSRLIRVWELVGE